MESSNAPTNFNDLREILLNNIKKIQDKTLDLKEAKEIVSHVNTVVKVTKLELYYHKNFKDGKPREMPLKELAEKEIKQ